uniref:Uncharacterized protein n=1 Tax=Romanomermis culicivorax TaxID=13658 RepID=A0A915I766_ROMCU
MFGRTLFMLLLLMALNLSQARPIIIDTMYGKIQGFEMTTADGAKANVFLAYQTQAASSALMDTW